MADDSGYNAGTTDSPLSSPSSSSIMGASGVAGASLGLVGLLGGLYFGSKEASYEKQAASESQLIAGYEEQINQQHQMQMQLYGQRQQMENFRNVQRTRAMGMASAVNSGAQYGSGIAGGQGSAANRGGQNTLALNQNLQIGNQIFGLTSDINQAKIAMTGFESQAATYQGYSNIMSGVASLGSNVMKAGQYLGPVLGS